MAIPSRIIQNQLAASKSAGRRARFERRKARFEIGRKSGAAQRPVAGGGIGHWPPRNASASE